MDSPPQKKPPPPPQPTRAADDQALCAEKPEIPPWKTDVSEALLDVSEEKEIATAPRDDH